MYTVVSYRYAIPVCYFHVVNNLLLHECSGNLNCFKDFISLAMPSEIGEQNSDMLPSYNQLILLITDKWT